MDILTPFIKAELRKGGLVLAERASGKTTALMQIFLEQKEYRVMVPTVGMKHHLVQTYKIRDTSRIFLGNDHENLRRLRGAQFDPRAFLLIDEYFHCGYEGPFRAAVGTPPFPVRPVIRTALPQLDASELIGAMFGDGYDLSDKELDRQRKNYETLTAEKENDDVAKELKKKSLEN